VHQSRPSRRASAKRSASTVPVPAGSGDAALGAGARTLRFVRGVPLRSSGLSDSTFVTAHRDPILESESIGLGQLIGSVKATLMGSMWTASIHRMLSPPSAVRRLLAMYPIPPAFRVAWLVRRGTAVQARWAVERAAQTDQFAIEVFKPAER
jgi:hypothetical protein